MSARVSAAGFTGAQVPFFKITHHHGRLIGSAEADRTVSYDYGHGAYYSSMIDQGFPQVRKLWEATSLQDIRSPASRTPLAREREGAAKYLSAVSSK